MGGLSGSTTKPNENTIKISVCLAVTMIAVWSIVITSWTWYATQNIPEPLKYLHENFANVLSALASMTILVYGYKITNDGVFNKGGTNWYPRNYLNIYVDFMTRKVRKKYEALKDTIFNDIRVLTNTGDSEFETPYFKYIYKLQDEDDFTFYIAWNNLNYFSGVKHKERCVYKHYKRVEFYIFSRVYERHMVELAKGEQL